MGGGKLFKDNKQRPHGFVFQLSYLLNKNLLVNETIFEGNTSHACQTIPSVDKLRATPFETCMDGKIKLPGLSLLL